MPSLPPSTYYHYFPFGITDMNTSSAIWRELLCLLLKATVMALIWQIGNYNLIFVEWDEYVQYNIFLIGQLYWFLIPYTMLLYIVLTILFEPLSLHRNSKHYIFITSIWTLVFTFMLTAIMGINEHHDEQHSIFHQSIFGNSNSFCRRMVFKDCYFFSVYIVTLYTFSFFILLSISSCSLYIIQIYPKSDASILLQSIFCCKWKYWKLLYSKKYRLKKEAPMGFGAKLISSEIDSDFVVENERELKTKYLTDADDENANAFKQKYSNESNQTNKNNKFNCCLQYITRAYRKISFLYHDMSLPHKYLLLIIALSLSFLICFIISTFMDIAGTGSLAKDNYEIVMILWLIICYVLKVWMKFIGKHIDILRVDMKWRYCTDFKAIKHLRNLTRMTTTRSRTLFKFSPFVSPQAAHTATNSNTTIINFEEEQSEVNGFKFEMSLEVALEIFMQTTYYAFYRDYSFIFYHPTWSQFLSFKFIHLFVIFLFYFVRILPFYYEHTSNLTNGVSSKKREKRDKNRDTLSTINWPRSQTDVFMVTPGTVPDPKLTETDYDKLYSDANDNIRNDNGSIDVLKLSKAITDYSDVNETEHTLHINAPNNVLVAFYDYATPTDTLDSSTLSSTSKNDHNKLSVPPVYITPAHSPNDLKISNIHSMNTTFETYHDWRNRISIDCVIRCIAMIFTTLASFCSMSTYYLTKNYGFLNKEFDAEQFIDSTYYFIISIATELMLYGLLYVSMTDGSFNFFQPFACLYAKSTHPYHYAILFVVCSWWIY